MTNVAPVASGFTHTRAELEPVREALLADARAEGDRLIADATREASVEAGDAEREAAAEIERARRRGAASAQARAEQEHARALDIGHHQVLQAQDDIRGHFLGAVHTAALELRDDPRYPALLHHLELLARDQLGPNTHIEHDSDGLGGIVGISGARRVDYTLPALADRAVDTIADKVALLWN